MISSINYNYKQYSVATYNPPARIKQEMIQNLDRHTLAVYKNGKVKYYNQRNLKPVFLALEENNFDLKNAYIVDRRVSKASAVLFASGNASFIKTPLMSKSAREFFDKQGIKYEADEFADSVVDKNSKIKCPLEQLVLDIDNPQLAYKILKQRVFPKGIDFEKQFYKDDMTPEKYKALDKKLELLYLSDMKTSFKGRFYDATAFIQSHTLLNRGLTNIGGCAVPNAIMSNTKEEALERLSMSAMTVSFAFLLPLVLLPKYNCFFLKKNGIVNDFKNNEKKIIQLSKRDLIKNTKDFINSLKESGKELNAVQDFNNILIRYKGKEDILRNKLLNANRQILCSDFISTGILMGSIPWIATSVTEYKTGRKGFSAVYNMLDKDNVSEKNYKKNFIKRLMGTICFAVLPGIFISKFVYSRLSSNVPNLVKRYAHNFDYTSGVSMSKTINAMKWAATGFLAKLPSSRDKYELRDRTVREGATFLMFFGGDFFINNILGRLSDRFLGTKIMNFSDTKQGFWKKFAAGTKSFKSINKMHGLSPNVLKRTKNIGAALYWVSLLSNMSLLGFVLPHYMNKLLKFSVEKDKAKYSVERKDVFFNDVGEWLESRLIQNSTPYKL